MLYNKIHKIFKNFRVFTLNKIVTSLNPWGMVEKKKRELLRKKLYSKLLKRRRLRLRTEKRGKMLLNKFFQGVENSEKCCLSNSFGKELWRSADS